MMVLFGLETKAFLESRWRTSLALDSNKDSRVRVNFNITMLDLKCEFAVMDVVSVLGTEQNVSSSVTKWHMDAEGVRQRFQGRNKYQRDIALKDDAVEETIEELLADGEDAISLDDTTFEFAKKENQFLFVDMYANWCSHCRDLAPTWETLAEVMDETAEVIIEANAKHKNDWTHEDWESAKKVLKPVMIAKIDCVLHPDTCRRHNVRAYPTLKFFVRGAEKTDYRGHRTVLEMTQWLHEQEDKYASETNLKGSKNKTAMEHAKEQALDRMGDGEDMSAEEKQWSDNIDRKRRRNHQREWRDEDHPGCQLVGHLMLDRVPGNFHIQARSNHHDLAPHMTNVSHIVHSLTLGEPMVTRMLERGGVELPPEVDSKFTPMNGNAYVTKDLHEAYHHYLKVITTDVEGLAPRYRRPLKAYQIIQSSQLSYYRNDIVPEAKFVYDLSPIAVSYDKTSVHWYDYLTSVMAIIGGTFTLVGMMEGAIHSAVHGSRSRRRGMY